MKINREQVVASIVETLLSAFEGHGEFCVLADVDGTEQEGTLTAKRDGTSIAFSVHFADEGDGVTVDGKIEVRITGTNK